MAKRVSIINFKGGVGKTTLAFHLASGLARYHAARVLLIDVDHQSSLSILCLGATRWAAVVKAENTVDRVFRHVTGPGRSMPGPEIVVKAPLKGYARLDLVAASLQLDNTEIELTATQVGSAIQSEWIKRTLLCQWIEESRLDSEYDYIIFDCPPATKIVSQNAIAASHGYVVPVVPEAVMERGAPHLVSLIGAGIDEKLKTLEGFGEARDAYAADTKLVGLVVTRIRTSRGASGYTNDHTEHLRQLRRRWGASLVQPYIEDGVGISESLSHGLPVYDRQRTQNVGGRGFARQFQAVVSELKKRVDAL